MAYTFDPASGWDVLRPDNGDDDSGAMVEAQKGYIVFASADGWVTP